MPIGAVPAPERVLLSRRPSLRTSAKAERLSVSFADFADDAGSVTAPANVGCVAARIASFTSLAEAKAQLPRPGNARARSVDARLPTERKARSYSTEAITTHAAGITLFAAALGDGEISGAKIPPPVPGAQNQRDAGHAMPLRNASGALSARRALPFTPKRPGEMNDGAWRSHDTALRQIRFEEGATSTNAHLSARQRGQNGFPTKQKRCFAAEGLTLLKLCELRQSGLLTQVEFSLLKAELLQRI